jgi:magnesium transporter
MNFEHMPELRSPYGYTGVWVVVILTVLGVIIWFRRQGWTR